MVIDDVNIKKDTNHFNYISNPQSYTLYFKSFKFTR